MPAATRCVRVIAGIELKQKVLLWVGVVVSATFLYIALRGIAFGEFVAAMRRIDVMPVIAAFAVLLFIYFVRTLRWRAIIRANAEITAWQTFSILMIGFFANNVLPARAGEIVRAVLLRRQIDVSRSYALGTIVVERVSDVAALVALLLVALYRIPMKNLPSVTGDVRAVAIVVLVVFAGGMVVLLWGRAWVVRVVRRVFSLVMPDSVADSMARRFDHLSRGLEVLRRPRELVLVSVLSVVSWAAMVLVFWLIFHAFHFGLPAAAAGLTVALVNLGMVVPSSPGYVGTYEFFIVKALGAFGIASGAALAFGVVTRLLWYVFEVVVGFTCLWYSHLPIKQLFRMGSRPETVLPETQESTGSTSA